MVKRIEKPVNRGGATPRIICLGVVAFTKHVIFHILSKPPSRVNKRPRESNHEASVVFSPCLHLSAFTLSFVCIYNCGGARLSKTNWRERRGSLTFALFGYKLCPGLQ